MDEDDQERQDARRRAGVAAATFTIPGIGLSGTATTISQMASWWLLGPMYALSAALLIVGVYRVSRANAHSGSDPNPGADPGRDVR